MSSLISQYQKSAFICEPICAICGEKKDFPLISADVLADLAERNISVHLRAKLHYLRENIKDFPLISADVLADLAELKSAFICVQICIISGKILLFLAKQPYA